MTHSPLVTAIWICLGGLGLAAGAWVLYRIQFFLEIRLVRLPAIKDWLAACRNQKRLPTVQYSETKTWIAGLLEESQHERDPFLVCCEQLKRRAQTYNRMLPMAQDAAPALGLLGTVFGLMGKAVGVDNPTEIVGLALGTTAAGLAIALAVLIAQSVLAKHEERLLEQIDLVLDGLLKPDGTYPGGCPAPTFPGGPFPGLNSGAFPFSFVRTNGTAGKQPAADTAPVSTHNRDLPCVVPDRD